MEEDIKFIKAKEKFTNEITKLIKVDDIVNTYISRYRSFEKYYPELKSFDQYLNILNSKLPKSKRNKIIEKYNYEVEKRKHSDSDGNVSMYNAPGILQLTEKVFKKLVATNLLKPAGYIQFRKWGKVLETAYFQYDALYKIKNESLEELLNTLYGFKDNNTKLNYNQFVRTIEEKYSVQFIKDKFFMKIDIERFNIFIIEPTKLKIIPSEFDNKRLMEYEDVIKKDLSSIGIKKLKINESINKIIDELSFTNKEFSHFSNLKNGMNSKKLNDSIKEINSEILRIRKDKEITDLLDLKKYHSHFLKAKNREISFIVGPTNSGKTTEALKDLMKSNSGIYLAPLRLLALEIYEKMIKSGIPCNLITGEESVIDPEARHTSSTIECLDEEKEFDCAIIDEIQMIGDKSRGWAWTRALFGVAAKKVYVIGNQTATNHAKRMFALMGEIPAVIKKERLSNLTVEHDSLELKDLKKGDALIAFSKKDVLLNAKKIKKSGKSVSIVYGALTPSVRKIQSELFSNGTNDILVSTDAIGMGLNLPIKRIIFSTLCKFDGESKRLLNATEIRQIAGRAGRSNEDGYIGLLGDKFNRYTILDGLNANEINITAFPIMPSIFHVKTISKMLETTSIFEILTSFPKYCNSENYFSVVNENMLLIADFVDGNINQPVWFKLKICQMPVNMKNESELSFFLYALNKTIINGEKMSFNKINKLKNISYENIQYADEQLKNISIFKSLSKITNNIILDGIDDIVKDLEMFLVNSILSVNDLNIYEYDYNDFFNY